MRRRAGPAMLLFAWLVIIGAVPPQQVEGATMTVRDCRYIPGVTPVASMPPDLLTTAELTPAPTPVPSSPAAVPGATTERR